MYKNHHELLHSGRMDQMIYYCPLLPSVRVSMVNGSIIHRFTPMKGKIIGYSVWSIKHGTNEDRGGK